MFLVQRYEKHENQMKGCALELKVSDWQMSAWTLWACGTVRVWWGVASIMSLTAPEWMMMFPCKKRRVRQEEKINCILRWSGARNFFSDFQHCKIFFVNLSGVNFKASYVIVWRFFYTRLVYFQSCRLQSLHIMIMSRKRLVICFCHARSGQQTISIISVTPLTSKMYFGNLVEFVISLGHLPPNIGTAWQAHRNNSNKNNNNNNNKSFSSLSASLIMFIYKCTIWEEDVYSFLIICACCCLDCYMFIAGNVQSHLYVMQNSSCSQWWWRQRRMDILIIYQAHSKAIYLHNRWRTWVKGELNLKIKLDLNDSICTLINKYSPHIF